MPIMPGRGVTRDELIERNRCLPHQRDASRSFTLLNLLEKPTAPMGIRHLTPMYTAADSTYI
jgi:hypothetical protein